MRIDSFRLVNFKGWIDTNVLNLAPITGIFGSNSSGKTALLQALLILKQTAESQDRSRVLHTGDERTYVDVGTFDDVVHGHNSDNAMRIEINWSVPGNDLNARFDSDEELPDEETQISFRTEISERGEGETAKPVVLAFEYKMNSRSVGMTRREDEDDKYDLKKRRYSLRRKKGRAWPLPAPIKCYGFPDKVFEYFLNADALGELTLAFEEFMAAINYVGPLREYPKRTYTWAGEPPRGVGKKGQHAVHAMLAARAEGRDIARGKDRGRRYIPFEKYIATQLKELGLVSEFELKPIARGRKEYEVRVRTSPKSTRVLLTDVGFGVSQILPVLVQCYYAKPGDILVFEQPEIHLHPRVQAGLADIFIDTALNRHVQIILESHSEYLLRRLQTRIAEEAVPAETVALYFCQRDPNTRELRADRLQLDLFGNITNWPADFFADDMKEAADRAKAEIRRKRGR